MVPNLKLSFSQIVDTEWGKAPVAKDVDCHSTRPVVVKYFWTPA